ncbi:hypothetical protein Fmac_012048 [Flemingia macrophylla]|uniref:Uncharacterized protein n=1 Tax=Flemingia macrophylla TaxID=520843 RepID=A0ABD1MP65_9FABA
MDATTDDGECVATTNEDSDCVGATTGDVNVATIEIEMVGFLVLLLAWVPSGTYGQEAGVDGWQAAHATFYGSPSGSDSMGNSIPSAYH